MGARLSDPAGGFFQLGDAGAELVPAAWRAPGMVDPAERLQGGMRRRRGRVLWWVEARPLERGGDVPATCGMATSGARGRGGEMALERWVTGFTQYLAVERRLSWHTQRAYERDVRAWLGTAGRQGITDMTAVLTRGCLLKFLDHSQTQGLSPRSLARRMASLRAFCRFLRQEGVLTTDPLFDLATPRVAPRLPRLLSVDEVDRLLRQPRLHTPRGIRDAAMLEVLYATGLRVSELVSLPMSAVHLAEGWIKVRGKGGKERLVPLGEQAVERLRAYLAGPRERLARGAHATQVFV